MNTLPRLLIVDDEPFNRTLLKRIFKADCEIVEAGNGQEALDLLEESTFDLMLLDIMMPGMSGLDVLKIVRQTTTIAELPVILISALAQDEEVACGISLGANDYITKPINIDIVMARVRTQVTLKHLNDERIEMMNYLQAANELKVRLMHVAAHDLKNPLNNLGMVLSLQRDSNDMDSVQSLIELGEGSIKAMRRVIEDFLDMGMFSAEGMTLNIEPLDLENAIRDVISQYAATARSKHIELCIGDISGAVMGDERRFMQALSNLVSNAIKYSPAGRRVTFSTEYGDGSWRVIVQDDGPGIPAEEQATLFEAFKRGSNKPTGGETSTGLGLWIVREMIKLQHGNIGVYCPADGGSCFWIELPEQTGEYEFAGERMALAM